MLGEKLTIFYSRISNKLNEIIPMDWEKVIMYAEDVGNVSSAIFYFYSEDGKYHYSNDIPEEYSVSEKVFEKLLGELLEINHNLRQEFIDNKEEPWNSLIFSLDKEWKFKVKFSYDLDVNISGFEREVRWAYDELKIVPKGEFAKQLLDEYLEEKDN